MSSAAAGTLATEPMSSATDATTAPAAAVLRNDLLDFMSIGFGFPLKINKNFILNA